MRADTVPTTDVEDVSILAFEDLDSVGPLKAVFHVRRTGTIISRWTRSPIADDVTSVMLATLLASVHTIERSLGGTTGETVTVTTDYHRIVAKTVGPESFLVLLASVSEELEELESHANRLVSAVRARAAARPAPRQHVRIPL